MIEVPLVDLKTQYARLKTEINAALNDVCETQRFILGPSVAQLEQCIAEYCQCRYAIGTSSGSDALLMALMALDIGTGDEVITTAYSFFATAGSIARAGARPLFCDIDPLTYQISPIAVADFIAQQCDERDGQLINRDTGGVVKAIIPVHLYGMCADMTALSALAKRYSLKIIEDAAQALGTENEQQQRAGSFGDIACFSFFPSKNLGAFGDAGICTTNDAALAGRLRVLREHGAQAKYQHTFIGGNFRLDELQAAVLLVKFDYLDEWISQRQQNAYFYNSGLANSRLAGQLITPQVSETYACGHSYHQYVIRVTQNKRDELKRFLSDKNIATAIYYPIPLPMQPCFDYLENQPQNFSQSCLAAAQSLALPVYPELSEVQKQYVVDSITAFFQRN